MKKWLLLFLLVVSTASAQSTGSSFGGGDWSSGGGSSSSAGSGSSGYSSSGYGSGVSYDDPNAIVLPAWQQFLIAVAFLGLLFGLFRLMQRAQRGGAGGPIDVAMVQIAIDAPARSFVQTTLRNLGRRGDTVTSVGRAELLSATVRALRSAKLAWIYAGTKSFDPMPAARAQSELKRLADDARAGFQHELERAADGKKASTSAPELAPKEHEGQGTVLVTVLAAARTKLRDVRAQRVDELDALLAQLASIAPAALVAIEVVWTPSAENDRMSTDELEKHYPALTKLDGAIGGRVYCSSCRGPFAAELKSCPHCGAPT